MMLRSRYKLTIILIFVSALFITACGKQQYEPVAINEHTDRCAICNMSVADDPHATQIITTDGQPILFDDIGCMYEWIEKNGSETIGIAFVRDYESKTWLKLEDAYYVYEPSIRTPMAYGVVSFADEATAQAYVSELQTGVVLDAEQLGSHSWERNPDMMHGEHSHGHDADEHDTHTNDAHGHSEGHDGLSHDDAHEVHNTDGENASNEQGHSGDHEAEAAHGHESAHNAHGVASQAAVSDKNAHHSLHEGHQA